MSKLKGEPSYTQALEQVFKELDDAKAGNNHPIFKKFDDKEHYETRLMFAVRKRQAAKYHMDNLIENHTRAATEAKKHAMAHKKKRLGSATKFTASVTRPSSDCAHELAAFFAALRSGLDFLTMAASRSLPGTTAHSIHTLMKMVEKGQSAPVLAVVAKHLAWLNQLKDYRDEIVHRMVIQQPTTGWKVSHNGKTSTAILPVVVPTSIPKFMPDTRRSRMMDAELPLGLDLHQSTGTVTYPDGSQKVLEHTVKYSPAEGYAPVDKFMRDHLKAYDAFLNDVLVVLAMLKFEQPKLHAALQPEKQ
ncbi:MAG: hypothetical protein JO004_08665 [Methylobacteriaceae bacterium]|nr:hypothetical protein [Methylobacteriaceae bacterium]